MEYLTIQETMRRLNISRQAVYNAIGRGALTAHKKYGKTLLDAAEVAIYKPNNYLDKRHRGPGRPVKYVPSEQEEEGAQE